MCTFTFCRDIRRNSRFMVEFQILFNLEPFHLHFFRRMNAHIRQYLPKTVLLFRYIRFDTIVDLVVLAVLGKHCAKV